MKRNTYVTFVEWEHEGKPYKRMQEQYDLNSVLCYVRHLDWTKIKAATHIYNSERELIEVVDWNSNPPV